MRIASRQPRRPMALRQPSMPYLLVHRPALHGGALHQFDGGHFRGFTPDEGVQSLFQYPKGPPGAVSPGTAQGDMGPERAPFRGEPQGAESLLHTVLQELEGRIGDDAGPDNGWMGRVGKGSEPL